MAEVAVRRYEIARGQRGIRQTIAAMHRLAVAGAKDPAVMRVAREVVSTVPENDRAAEAGALCEYVRSHCRYTLDSSAAEVISDPRYLVAELEAGRVPHEDCDGFVTLLAALVMAVGGQARFVTRSQGGSPHDHVYVEVMTAPGVWLAYDPILRPRSDTAFLGYTAPGVGSVEFHAPMGGGSPMRTVDGKRIALARRRMLMGRARARLSGHERMYEALTPVRDIRVASYPSGLSGITDPGSMDALWVIPAALVVGLVWLAKRKR
jgi:hypothetical protein